MKEEYFTNENISAVAREMAVFLRRKKNPPTVTGTAALLVLDMQDYFIDPCSHAAVPSAPAIIHGIAALMARFSRCGYPVFRTRHINTAENAAMMAKWWRETLTDSNPLSALISSLPTSPVIEKNQYDAFYKTGLEASLRSAGADRVIITGVMTHLCCETTARSAFVRGFEVIFPIDGTATYNRSLHMNTLQNLAHGFAALPLMEELL